MRQFDKLSLDNEKLLHHITDKHLPLHCVLCGELFETEEDLKSLGNPRNKPEGLDLNFVKIKKKALFVRERERVLEHI